jgi:hypothetical protein
MHSMGRLGLTFLLLLAMGGLAAGIPDGSVLLRGTGEPVEGVVREASGQPVVSAYVKLMRNGRALASTRTDRDGRFQIALAGELEGELSLRIERLGYRSKDQPLAPGTWWVEVELEPAPLPLPGFEVEGIRDVCEGTEDAEARALWEVAARRHPAGLDTLGVATYLQAWNDTLTSEAEANDAERLGTPGQRGSAPLLRLSWTRRIPREGYAFPVRRSDRERSYDSWSYPPLEADFAPHFVHEAFGELQRFQVDLADRDGWVLRFCSRRRDQPYLEGTMELTPDTLLQRVEWQFQTPDPDESAGGWARFPMASLDEPAPLPLPVESMTWRQLPGGEVLRKAQSYEGWVLAPGDSVPFLRSRASARPEVAPPGLR